MKPLDFVAKVAPLAQDTHKSHGVPASVTIAQAALESGWGEHAPGNNLFGIKADRSWTGPATYKSTSEVIRGQRVQVTAAFRAYLSWAGSLNDHADFLRKNPRYKAAFQFSNDGEKFARAIAAAGYATDPNYASLLVSIIRKYGLSQYDEQEGE